jgi:hypothetical protein
MFRESEKGLKETPGGFLFRVMALVRVRKRDKSLPGCVLILSSLRTNEDYARNYDKMKDVPGLPITCDNRN